MKRLNYTTVVGANEHDIEKFISEIIDAFNDYHKTVRDVPPPYLAVDIGKVVGLYNGLRDAEAKNTRLREALEKITCCCIKIYEGDSTIHNEYCHYYIAQEALKE